MKSKLIKLFSNNDIPTPDFNNIHIQTEPVYISCPVIPSEVNTLTQTHFDDEDTEYQTDYINENDVELQDEYHTLYTQKTKIPPRMKNSQRTLQHNTYQSPNYQQQNYYQQSQRSHQIQTNQTNTNWRNMKPLTLRKMTPKGRNPYNKNDVQTRCSVCQSINHWATNCPENNEHNTYVVNEVVLHQSDYDSPKT